MANAAPRRGPGPVAGAHKLLIVSALVCALVYAAWEAREFSRSGDRAALVVAGLALGAASGLGVYLRSLRRLGARLTASDETRRGA